MWNGIGWYGFIGPTTSTTDISLYRCYKYVLGALYIVTGWVIACCFFVMHRKDEMAILIIV